MFEVNVQIVDETHKVIEAANKAAYENFRHAAASIRLEARESIKTATPATRKHKGRKGKGRRASKGSAPGTPPLTRRRLLPNAIVFNADKFGAIIGPRFARAGTVGMAHEFGGKYKTNKYPARPFMGPALEANVSRFAASWRNSIKP